MAYSKHFHCESPPLRARHNMDREKPVCFTTKGKATETELDEHGTICVGANATTYLRSEGTRLMEFAIHSIKNVTLNMCANACTTKAEGHECSSFEYDARSQECSIHSEDGQPFGASVLTKTDGPIAFFQQMCVQGDALCSTPYGFERYPQSLLIGHAMKPPASLHTQCRSAMFFYETGECIINRERRSDWPELFIDGVQDQLVDYFENNCQDVHCFNGQLHWIRTEEYYINHEKDVIIESMSIERSARQLRFSVLLRSEKLPATCQQNLITNSKIRPCMAFRLPMPLTDRVDPFTAENWVHGQARQFVQFEADFKWRVLREILPT
ncbi:PAN domain protein, partial [Ostertagia ostertagi]